uniref:DOMON domain-containing protein n=1 Tax=Meloidogyne floridensis TaxID=298350 RepID=A0A915P047_9BILA
MRWTVDWTEQLVEFTVYFSPSNLSAVLIGFSDHGKFAGSDFCIYQVKSRKLTDGWLDSHLVLHKDIKQDCHLLGARTSVEPFFQFQRKFSTCDPRDFRFDNGTSNIILAVSTKKNSKSLKDMVYEMRYTKLLTIGLNNKEDKISSRINLQTMEIRANSVLIPPQTTTYYCSIIELPSELKQTKHHAIKYEAVITPGNEQFVHHFEVFHCQTPTRPFAGDCSSAKPTEAKSCSKVLAAWSMGANPVVFPPQAGMPLGGPGFIPFLMVEIHYNNPALLSGYTDSSGLKITFTKHLRLFDAGIMELGLIYSDANSVPPMQKAWPLTGYCPNECIYIFASQLHAHLTGRKLFTSLIRNGRKIGEINRDDHYSPHWQHIQPLEPHINVLPGGYGIEDEMCVNYIHYYPASEIEVCKSAVSNSSLHSFFSKLGVVDKRLSIQEKYLSIKWNTAKIGLLREFYHVSPLNGHPSNWTRVIRPEYLEAPNSDGIYKSDECLAIND